MSEDVARVIESAFLLLDDLHLTGWACVPPQEEIYWVVEGAVNEPIGWVVEAVLGNLIEAS